MEFPDLTSEKTIRDFASNRLQWPADPWRSGHDEAVESFYPGVCDDLCRDLGLHSRIEWNHYGSGYASFVDAWFYRDTPDFEEPSFQPGGRSYTGLWVLLHRLCPCFVAGQGEKSWDEMGDSSYVPDLDSVDEFESDAVAQLSGEVEQHLARRGFIRLRRKDVDPLIPEDIEIETILDSGRYHVFDAIFHWED